MKLSRLLVGIDSSKEAGAAQRHALHIAHRKGAEMILAHACPRPELSLLSHNSTAVFKELVLPEILASFGSLSNGEHTQPNGFKISKLFIDGSPDPGLAHAASERDVDLVVVGTHGRSGVRRALLGSVAERTVRFAETNVLVARGAPPEPDGYRHILVPTDFSDSAEQALQMALELASPSSSIELMHCWSQPMRAVPIPVVVATPAAVAVAVTSPETPTSLSPTSEDLREVALAEGQRLVARYRHDSIKLYFELVADRPGHAILERLQSGTYDLCAMGSHGRRGLRRLLLGSVAESIVRHAPCSVLVSHAVHA